MIDNQVDIHLLVFRRQIAHRTFKLRAVADQIDARAVHRDVLADNQLHQFDRSVFFAQAAHIVDQRMPFTLEEQLHQADFRVLFRVKLGLRAVAPSPVGTICSTTVTLCPSSA